MRSTTSEPRSVATAAAALLGSAEGPAGYMATASEGAAPGSSPGCPASMLACRAWLIAATARLVWRAAAAAMRASAAAVAATRASRASAAAAAAAASVAAGSTAAGTVTAAAADAVGGNLLAPSATCGLPSRGCVNVASLAWPPPPPLLPLAWPPSAGRLTTLYPKRSCCEDASRYRLSPSCSTVLSPAGSSWNEERLLPRRTTATAARPAVTPTAAACPARCCSVQTAARRLSKRFFKRVCGPRPSTQGCSASVRIGTATTIC